MKFKKISKLFILGFILFIGIFYFTPVLAQSNTVDTFGIEAVDSSISLGSDDIRVTIAKIIRAVLGLLGLIAVIIVIYGGFVYMTSGGEEDKIAKGKKILINGVIGLVIILMSLIIVQFLLNKLSEATGLVDRDIDPRCRNIEFALENPDICDSDTLPDICELKHFVVTSITPVTNRTGMNNVAVRTIFSRQIDYQIGDITIKHNGSDMSGEFDFEVKGTGAGYENSLVEAQYTGTSTCADGTKCLPFGSYEVEVSRNISDNRGNSLETETDCGDYPNIGRFTVVNKDNIIIDNLAYFNGVNSYLKSSSTSSLDNIGLSLWVKPNLNHIDDEQNAVYSIFQMGHRNTPGGMYHLYLVDYDNGTEENNLKRDKIDLVWWYNSTKYSSSVELGDVDDLNNKWMHIFINNNVTDGNYQIFVNNNLVREGNIEDGSSVVDKDILIGAYDNTPSDNNMLGELYFFKGVIHNLYLFSNNLNVDQIDNIYNSGNGFRDYNLNGSLIHLSLNEGSNQEVNNFIYSNLEWRQEETNLSGTTFTKDTTKPIVSDVRLADGNKLDGSYLLAGGVYEFSTEIVDKINTFDGGAGFVHMNLKKVDSVATGYNFFAGPSIARGSDTTNNNPYEFEYKRLNIPRNATPLESFLLTLDVSDIDNNHTIVTSTFTIIASHCRNGVKDGDEIAVDVGGSCGSTGYCIQDSDCAFTYKCVDSEPAPIPPATGDYRTKTCQPFPYIQEVDPMDGGSGNWISVLGYNFGSYIDNSETGTIEFGLDTDGDNQPDSWKQASIVSCGDDNKPSWNSDWVVIEVPENDILPLGSLSAIRLTTARKIKINGVFQKLQDTTIDDWGENPGPKTRKGWFLKNDILRPGLCKVENEKTGYTGSPLGMISDPVKAIGKGFGSSGSLYFNNIQSSIRGWSESWITSFVPNLDRGRVPVLVESGGQKSNKVPFTIIIDDDDIMPVITIIDPASTTPGSYLTIIGRNFGDDPGAVYLSSNKGGERCGNDSDCEAMDLSMPLFCGDTWSDNQIIVEVPEVNFTEEGIDFIREYITVKNTSELYSSGDNDFEIYNGPSLPSICKVVPSGGPAPLAEGETLALKGINFSLDPTVYFFTNESKIIPRNTTEGWLYTSFNSNFALALDSEDGGQRINTPIPYNENYGYSMRTGLSPIKLKDANNNFSNSIYYNVTDCRSATSTVPTGFQCCLEGEEAGQIKPNTIGCIGEPKNAGYVWRFTTGLLPNNPYVVVSCDQDNYQSSTEFPSPIPSLDWRSGDKACVNSVIAVRFGPDGVTMDEESINASTVKVYKCNSDLNASEGLQKDGCTLIPLEPMTSCEGLGCLVIENNILKIYIPPKDYLSNNWYHIELMKGIRSEKEFVELGVVTTTYRLLRVDRELTEAVENVDDNNVAFYFDFRTGGDKCVLTSALMSPASHTTNLLGVVQNPKYAFDFYNIFNPLHPLYYYLSGKGDQECSIIDVDGLGWEWGTLDKDGNDGEYLATSEIASSTANERLKRTYTDSRGKATAWMNTYPEDVTLFARITSTMERQVPTTTEVMVTGTDYYYLVDELADIKVVDNSVRDFSINKDAIIEVDIELEDIPTSTAGFVMKTDNGIYWERNRYILTRGYNTTGITSIAAGNYALNVRERHYSSGGITRELYLIYTYKEGNSIGSGYYDLGSNKRFKVFVEKDGDFLKLSYQLNNINPPVLLRSLYYGSFVANEGSLVMGGFYSNVSSNSNFISYIKYYSIKYDDLDLYQVSGMESGQQEEVVVIRTEQIATTTLQRENTEIKATSSLMIDLSDPKVIEYWPNCIEACINTQIAARFNMLMVTSSYKESGAVELYQCSDENCISLTNKTVDVGDDSDWNTIRFYPKQMLDPNTWYLVKLNDNIKAIGGFVRDKNGEIIDTRVGKSLNEFSWKFKTKDDPSPCLAESVDIIPDPLYIYSVGDKSKIQAQPNGSPDSCSPYGQALNPWFFTWSWSSFNQDVFQITNLSTSNSLNPYCGKNCLYNGSDISRNVENVFVCGNGIVEPGEDCDIALETNVPVSCAYSCLRPGNSDFVSATSTVDIGKCGDGFVSSTLGEECDPGIVAQKNYCTNICQWKGSNQVYSGEPGVSYCGSGSVTGGEDCDIAKDVEDNTGKLGCSANCLHLGTELSQNWCDNNKDVSSASSVCKNAVSVCGNGFIETGEECEVGLGDATVETCDNNCLLKNVCNDISLSQCEAGTEGCNNDCTLAGSSALYSVSSVCGDSEIGIGEFDLCEVTSSTLLAQYGTSTIGGALGQSPVQIATAIGESTEVSEIPGLNGIKGQSATSSAKTVGYFDDETIIQLLGEDIKEGLGDYHLVCGFSEFGELQSGKYNLCPSNNDNKKGVAKNSCCYDRPQRVNEYPVDGDGFSGEGVCRNTYIETVVDSYLDLQTVNNNNFGLVSGHTESNYNCSSTPSSIDLTEQVNMVLGIDNNLASSGSFLGRIWYGIKTFFARLFGMDANASDSYDLVNNIKVWCTVPASLSLDVDTEFETRTLESGARALNSSTTTISAYLQDLLDANTVYGVMMFGGANGIQDYRGVGIKNANEDNFSINDLWLFKTGNQICKIDEVSVIPSNYLFDTPNTEKSFRAEAKNTKGAKIVSTPAYEWAWSWGPTGHPVFNIPNVNEVSNTIRVGNLEGSVFGVAQAKIINDVSTENNHFGRIFTGLIELNAMFCENPWPLRGEGNTWSPYTDKYYGFSFSYCADKGISGNTADDLPYFDSFSLLRGNLTATSTLSTTGENGKIGGRDIRTSAASTIAEGELKETLQRALYFNETNDDVLGIQIFQNDQGFESSAASWYAEYFPDASTPTQITVSSGKKSYEGVKEGNNYYINAQNIVQENGDFVAYNNILAFSVNEGATQDTLNVLAQIIDSLALNLNVNDFGYCLTDGLVGITKLPMDPKLQAAISEVSCSSDFDCRDTNGTPLEGTNGICSNAETKFFRDIDRLGEIKIIQNALDRYFETYASDAFNFKADLKGGTYIPGYTVSTWPSWNNTLGNYLKDYLASDRLPLGEINTWTACTDTDAESQTCWNATESTYSCPAYSHVFEYEYVSSTGSYLLHSPLEFLSVDSKYASGINTSRFTEDPYCRGESFSLKAGICGDGIIQPGSGEECDPPGSSKLVSSFGRYMSVCGDLEETLQCYGEYNCPVLKLLNSSYYSNTIDPVFEPSVCEYENYILFTKKYDTGSEVNVFVCNSNDECRNPDLYEGKDINYVDGYGNTLTAGIEDNLVCSPITTLDTSYDPNYVRSCEKKYYSLSCPENQTSVATCRSGCLWEWSSCQSNTTCGNGIVEIGEACDDGALNGQYGQCADENSKKADGVTPVGACQGLHGQYCGNGVLDTKNGSPLEVCENLGDKLYLSYSNNIGKCNNDENRLCNISGNCSLSDSYALKFTNLKDPDTGGITKQWVAGNFEKLGLLVGNDLPNDFAVQIWFKKTETNDQDETFLIIAPDVMNPDSSGIVMKFLKKENVGSLVGNRFQVKYDYVDPKGVIKSDTIVTPPLFIWDEIKKESKWVLLTFSYNASVADNKIRLTYNQDSVDKYPGNSNNNYFVMPMSKDKTNVGIILGSFKPGEVDYFNGILDSFKIYHDLSSWPATDYNNGLGYLNMDGVGKVSALWSFDQGGGSVVKEDSNPDINRNLVLSANGMWIESEVARQGRCVEKKKQYTLLNFSEPNSLSQDSLDNICLIPGNLCSVDKYTKEMANYFGSTFANLTNDKSFANKYCSDDHTILCKTSADCVIPQDKNLVSNYLSVLKNGFDNFSLEYKNVGDCVDVISTPAASYNFNKQYSCKWDCQDYGQYCGDGTRNGDEECDFNDPNMKDRCDSQCRIIVDPIICGDGQVGGNEVCDTGKYCENITEKDLAKVCNSDSDCAGIGDGKCITRNIKYKDGNDQFVCSADCRTKTPYVSSCGNGILDQGEFCDTGANVGKVCEPGYGKSCNYCSADCSRVFTIDSPKYCGNGEIDQKDDEKYEVCDVKNGVVVTSAGSKICPDKGTYTCTDCDKDPGMECYSCENGYDIPKLSLINVTGQRAGSSDYALRFLRWHPLHYKILKLNLISDYKQIFTLDDGIFTTPECKNEYKFHFGGPRDPQLLVDGDKLSLDEPGDVFDYNTTDAFNFFYKDFIFSPAVPYGTYRMVVVWEGDDFTPNINIYNEWFSTSRFGDTIMNTIRGMSNLCTSNFPEDGCGDYFEGVYFHPQMKGDNSDLRTSAVTINTKNRISDYKIFISNLNTTSIGKLKNHNIKVYLYKYREGQSNYYSVYNPDKIFDISKSFGSDEDSVYWHVLDLKQGVRYSPPDLWETYYEESSVRDGYDGETLKSYSEINKSNNNFVLSQDIIDKIEQNKLYIYTDVFGYSYSNNVESKVDDQMAINKFDIYHYFNSKKSGISFDRTSFFPVVNLNNSISELNALNYFKDQPSLYSKNNSINNIFIGKIDNNDIYYTNGTLITELSDWVSYIYRNEPSFERSDKMEYLYSLRLLPSTNYGSSLKKDFFDVKIYRGTFVSPKILYKDSSGNIIVNEIPATYLNKNILESKIIEGDINESDYWVYNLFSFIFDYNENKIIIEPVNEFSSHEDMVALNVRI